MALKRIIVDFISGYVSRLLESVKRYEKRKSDAEVEQSFLTLRMMLVLELLGN